MASAGGLVHRVGQVYGRTRAALHQQLVAMRHQFAHAGRRQADAVLVVLDFPGAAYAHGQSPDVVGMPAL